LVKEKNYLAGGGAFILPTGEVIDKSATTIADSNKKIKTASERKKILITGGAGFIGSNFVRHLYTTYPDYQIFNLDLLTYSGNQENLSDIAQLEEGSAPAERRYVFIQGDICHAELLKRLFREHKFDAVVNFAAESHVDRSLCSSYDFIRTNVLGVHALIEACREHRIPRFVQISTDEVYGEVLTGLATEAAPLNPSNPYSASKASADVLIRSYMRSHDLPALIIRGSNNVGPYQYPEKLIPLAISNFLESRPIPVHGDGAHIRSWLYVRDFCRAIDLVLHRGALHNIYNASGFAKTNLEVLEEIRIALGMPNHLDAYKVHTSDRPGADHRYAPDSSKLQTELGWTREHSFAAMIKGTVDWYLQHEEWWRAIKEQQVFLEHYERQQKADYY